MNLLNCSIVVNDERYNLFFLKNFIDPIKKSQEESKSLRVTVDTETT